MAFIGADLARMEVRVALEELLRFDKAWVLDGPFTRTSWPLFGLSRLPVAFV